jgi:hypothetical protein
MQLLEGVKTGGWDNAKLKAKQLFGIESANEAELSNRLGKAVLSQLKSTFGSAFTEGEGRRLEVIEAGYGKSTAGNMRLLRDALKLTTRSIDRGIRSAELIGDWDAADEIRKAKELVFGDDDAYVPPAGFTEEVSK